MLVLTLLQCVAPLPLAAAEGYVYRPRQNYQVLAHKGLLGLEGIQPLLSVNNRGEVAFIGQVYEPDGGPLINGIYVANIPTSYLATITPGVTRETAERFGPEININNNNEVLTRRIVRQETLPQFGRIPFSYLDRWSLDSNVRVTLEAGRPPVPGWPPEEYEGLYGPCAQNNSGSFAFTAFSQGTDYLGFWAGSGNKNSIAPPPPVALMVSDNNRLVMQFGSIWFLAPDFSVAILAGTRNGFSEVGERPGISDDGSIVVFYGNLTTPTGNTREIHRGKGVFAILMPEQKIIRLAGIHGDRHCAPGEYWDDTRDGQQDGNFDGTTEEDIGLISDFHPNEQVSVNNNGSIAFLGSDIEAKKSIFFCRVNRQQSETNSSDPFCVAVVGQVIHGLDGAISDLSISDSLGDRGRPGDLVFWAHTQSGQEAVIATRPHQNPAIFIPGIAGSKLERPGDQLWPSVLPWDIRDMAIGQHRDVRPTDVARRLLDVSVPSIFPGFQEKNDIYNRFLDALGQRGFREIVPETTCAVSGTCRYAIPDDADTPDLFLFPYDWRFSNSGNAQHLRQYIQAIREMYPDAEVDLITHSMGGLLARSYLLQYPFDHHVAKCVTIGSPLLGAPVSYKRILDGDFFQVEELDAINGEAMREVLPNFTGFHELFPSLSYFAMDRFLFAERGWDINGNKEPLEDWDHSMIRQFFNTRYPSQPVSACDRFHTEAQDDWSRSGLDFVEYLHFVGVRSVPDTTKRVEAWEEIYVSEEPGKRPADQKRWLHEAPTIGDGTVPFTSAFRNLSMWAPFTHMTVVRAVQNSSSDDYLDHRTEHTRLTWNRRVQSGLLYFLRSGRRLWTDDAFSAPSLAGPAVPQDRSIREFRAVGVRQVFVKTPQGDESRYVPELGAFIHPDTVSYSGSEGSSEFIYAPTGTFVFTFRATNAPLRMLISLVHRDSSGTATAAARFKDIFLPQGSTAWITDTGAAPFRLEIDTNSDGNADRFVPARYVASGPAAHDEVPPRLSAQRLCISNEFFLQISASDPGAGVESIRYQAAENALATYTTPINARTIATPEVLAFATDNVGNRSHGYEFPLVPDVRALFAGGRVRILWEKSCWPFVLQSSPGVGVGADWQDLTLPIQDFGAEQGVDIPTVDRMRFFRLRLNLPSHSAFGTPITSPERKRVE